MAGVPSALVHQGFDGTHSTNRATLTSLMILTNLIILEILTILQILIDILL